MILDPFSVVRGGYGTKCIITEGATDKFDSQKQTPQQSLVIMLVSLTSRACRINNVIEAGSKDFSRAA